MCLPPSLLPASTMSPLPMDFSDPNTGPTMLLPFHSALSTPLFPQKCSYFLWTFTPLSYERYRFLDNYNMHEMLWPIFLAFIHGTLLFLSRLHIEADTIVNPTSNLTLVGIAVSIFTIPARLQICHKHCHTCMLTTSFLVKLQVVLYLKSMLFFPFALFMNTLNLICTFLPQLKMTVFFLHISSNQYYIYNVIWLGPKTTDKQIAFIKIINKT